MHNARKTAPIDAFVRAEVVARLRRGDVGAIQAGPAVDVSALRDEAATLRVRLDGLVDMRMDGTITPAQLARGTAKAEARLAEIGTALGSAAGNSALTPLLSAVDPGQAFLDASLDIQRAVISQLVTVTIEPAAMGTRVFNADSVKLDWLG